MTNFGVRALHGHCGPWKKMSNISGCDGETYDRGSPPPIPKPLSCTASASAVCRNAPNFWQRVWGPARGPHARDERKRTTNACCVTCGQCFRVFGAKNHRKSVQRRNTKSFGVRSLHGHCCPWKKMIDFGGCDREKYDRGSPPPIPKPPGCTASASSVCRNAPNFRRRVWGPARGPHARDERKRTTNASCVTCGQCFRGFRCEKS